MPEDRDATIEPDGRSGSPAVAVPAPRSDGMGRRSVAVVAVGNTVARGLGFAYPLVLGRLLDRPDFGMVLLAITTGFFVAELVLTGFPTALTRFLAAADPRTSPRAVMSAALVGGLPLLAGSLLVGAAMAAQAGIPPVLLAVVVIGLTIDAYYFAALRGLRRFGLLVGYRIAANGAQLLVIAVLGGLGMATLEAAVVVYALSYLVPIAVIEGRRRVVSGLAPRRGSLDRTVLSAMTRYAVPALISGTAYGAIFGLDTYAVGVLAAAALPDYAAARSLVMPMTLVPFAIGVVLMPRVAADRRTSARGLREGLAVAVAAGAAGVVGYALLGAPVVALVYPATYAGAAQLLVPLSIALGLLGLYSVVSQWSFGLGEPRLPAIAICLGAVVTVAAHVVLTAELGGTGAAIAIASGSAASLAALLGGHAVRRTRPRPASPDGTPQVVS